MSNWLSGFDDLPDIFIFVAWAFLSVDDLFESIAMCDSFRKHTEVRCDEREGIHLAFFFFLDLISRERERESKKRPFVVLVTCMVYEGWGSGDRTHIRVYCVLVLGYTCTWALRILKDIRVATSASFVLTRTGININNANSLLHGTTCIFSMVYTSTMKLNMVTFRQGWGSTSLDCCKCTKRNEPRCPLNHTQALVARLYQPSKPLGAKAVS